MLKKEIREAESQGRKKEIRPKKGIRTTVGRLLHVVATTIGQVKGQSPASPALSDRAKKEMGLSTL